MGKEYAMKSLRLILWSIGNYGYGAFVANLTDIEVKELHTRNSRKRNYLLYLDIDKLEIIEDFEQIAKYLDLTNKLGEKYDSR